MMLLEEDVVDARLSWKPQTIRHGADLLHHLEWPVEAWRELGLGVVGDAGRSALVQA